MREPRRHPSLTCPPHLRSVPRLATGLVLAAGLVGSAVSPVGAQVDQSERVPSVELPAELERVLRDYEARWAAGDAPGLAELFTEDGFVLSGGDPHVRGRDAIEERYRGAGGPLSLRAVAYEASGDVGFIIGAYAYDDLGDRGKFVLALQRVGGRWLIAADMDNPIRR